MIRKLREIDPTSFLQVKIKARYMRESNGVFTSTSLASLSATMRSGFDFRLLPLNILMTQECEIENIFPHLSMRQSKGNFGQHGTSKVSRKPEIDASFHIVSYLWCIVLWFFRASKINFYHHHIGFFTEGNIRLCE